ncbi:DMT family transporter [Nocardioides marmoribigeumensis]|uniref:Drug/metabolite transporter (DMT)-like permease n=1 Tax=Nocardioides marmoribigeumensis TaxID=433649 RepID=A0ABU2BXT1_9ACTN|nr:DMT family transporter [Nocardioides marmoribigeumensis]MDR7363194.1 drug/metabolite transporter (DMT)-like permease [Nocardioides marmoribigeumensis]
MTLTAVRADRRTARVAAGALVVVTAVWGSTFGLSKDLLERLPVTDYLGPRFLLAAAVVVLVRPQLVRSLTPETLVSGAGLGVLYAVGQLLQFQGLLHTAPTVSAFVVSLYVVFTPLLAAVLLRVRPGRTTMVATGLAVAGVATMSLRGWSFGTGEVLTVVSAALYAAHILAMAARARPGQAFPLTFVQLVTIGALLTVAAAGDGVQLPAGADVPAFLYLAVVAAGGALLVQTWAQARLSSSHAAVLMVLEPVWAAVFGVVLWAESVDARTLLGGALILAAMVLVVARPGADRLDEALVEPSPAHP